MCLWVKVFRGFKCIGVWVIGWFPLQPCVVVWKHADLSIACKDCICICVFTLQLKIFLSQAASEAYNGALCPSCSEALLVDFSIKKTTIQCILIRFCSMSNRCLIEAFSKMKPLKLYHSLRYTPKIRHGQHSCVSEENCWNFKPIKDTPHLTYPRI